MGGMQTLEWAVAYPEMVGAIAPIATPGRSSPQSIALTKWGVGLSWPIPTGGEATITTAKGPTTAWPLPAWWG